MNSVVLMVFALACVAAVASMPQFQGQGQGQKDGGWNVGVDKDRNGGTVVRAEGQKKWDVSADGRVKAEVHGHVDRTFGGPSHGRRDHGVGASISGQWGK